MALCLLVHPGAELFGADRMLLESAIGIKESGMDLLVALAEDGPLVSALKAEGIETVTIPMLVLRKALLRPRSWMKLVRGAVSGLVAAWSLITDIEPDSLYVSTVTLPQWPLVGAFRRIPIISHVHEAEGAASRWVNLAIYLPHLVSKVVLVNSEFALQTIRRSLPKLADQAEVVANGVVGPPAVPSEPRGTLEGVLRVLYLGRLSPRKGPDLIIEAASILRARGTDVRVVLAGSTFDGYEWFEEELRAAVRVEGLVEKEVFVGFRPSIWPLLEDHDVLVVPSRMDEPFGNTAVEGVLAHRPVIVSDTTGLREAAAGYPTAQLIHRDDSRALVAALEELVQDWGSIREKVGVSAEMARVRHDPATYRRRISDAVAKQIVTRRLATG